MIQQTGKLPTVPTASQGLTPLLFWKHRAELLGCSREELDAVVVKLVPTARETEQKAPAPGRDGLEDAGWSTPPMPVLKVGGRVLLCTPADLPRQLEPAGVPRTSDPDSDGEMVFIVVQAPSNTSHPADTNDKTPPKEPRSQDGQPGADAAALGESGEGTSRVLRMNLPSGRRAWHIYLCARGSVACCLVRELTLPPRAEGLCCAGRGRGHWCSTGIVAAVL